MIYRELPQEGLPVTQATDIKEKEVHLKADVIVVEPTGSETQIVARIGQQDLIAVIRDRRPVKPGDKIRLRPNPAAAHVFDKETGKRLIN